MPNRILFFENMMDGCTHYRTSLPYKQLSMKYNNIDITPRSRLDDDTSYSDFKKYDTFIFQRGRWGYLHEYFIPWAKKRNKKVIIDLDDNLWTIPDYNPSIHAWADKHISDLSSNIELADMVVCSTIPLNDYINTNFNPNTIVIPNLIEYTAPFKILHNNPVHICWAGSSSHRGDFSESLVRYLRLMCNQNKIKFTIFGEMPDFFMGFTHNVSWCPMDKYNEILHSLNFDIGIIVCKDNIFNQSKSNLKFLEYSSCSAITIADNIYPYTNTISHMETGILVNREQDWITSLAYLIQNKHERIRIATNAHDYVTRNYTYRHTTTNLIQWETLLDLHSNHK